MFSVHNYARSLCGPLAAATLALAHGACSDDPGGADAADTHGDTLPGGRTYLLAARAESYDPAAARPYHPSLASLTLPAEESPVEAVVIPADLLGLPWGSFNGPDNRPSDLPAAWLAAVDSLRALADSTGKPIALALSPLSPEYDTLAPQASDQSGALVLNPSWKPACYDPSKDSDPNLHAQQFGGYAAWMVERFEPRFVILGQRLNLYEATCGASAYEAVVGYVAAARARIATATVATAPTTVATLDVEDLYGFPKKAGRCQTGTAADCLASRKALLAPVEATGVDHLGLESYPSRAFADADAIPSDWLAQVADLTTLPALIAGTGLPAVSLETDKGACVPLLASSEDAQRRWLDQVLAVSAAEDAPLVVWRSLVDLLPAPVVASCPCAGDFQLCAHLDGLGGKADQRRPFFTSGLADSGGTARSALALWRTVLAPR